MNDTPRKGGAPSNVRSLSDAIRRVRLGETDRSDVAADFREAEQARLELLADELRDVFAEVPAEDEQFVFSISHGTQPRLWIDSTAFVTVGRDRRTYRFLKDTRLGRTVIVESASLDDVADTVTNYVAERIIERERAIEGDWLIKRVMRDDPARPGRKALRLETEPKRILDNRHAGWIVAGFLGGVLIGAVSLFLYAWYAAGG